MTTEPPRSIKAFREARILEIGWNDGTVQRIPFKSLLRPMSLRGLRR